MFQNKASVVISYYALLVVLCTLITPSDQQTHADNGEKCKWCIRRTSRIKDCNYYGETYKWCYTSCFRRRWAKCGESSQTLVISANVSKPLSAQANNGWSVSKDACIKENNYKVIGSVVTIDDCKEKCIIELSNECQSIDYQLSSQLCLISTARSDSPDYEEPCTVSKGVEYTEVLHAVDNAWSGIKDACIKDNYKTFGGMLSIDDCKDKCFSELGKNCQSITYQPETKVCLISETWSISPGYEEPCSTVKGVQYTEIPHVEGLGCGVNSRIKEVKRRRKRIVGGRDADPKAWPWMAALLYKHNKTLFCGGVLITDSHVLTAAHCTQSTINDITVRLGDYDFTTSTDNNPEDFDVIEKVIHKDYTEFPTTNDIAILKLDRPATFNQFVSRICLPIAGKKFEGESGHVIGWGATIKNGISSNSSNILQEVVLPVWTKTDCNNAYLGKIKNTMLCAGVREGGKDSCQGDSGGPFMLQDKNTQQWFVAGIVAFGAACGGQDKPGVYTRVNHYLNWIRQNTDSITDLQKITTQS